MREDRVDTQLVEANGLTFSVRVSGPTDGEPVILLHGFPDNARTFDATAAALTAAGLRCLVPTMRGYEPSSQPADGDHQLATLAADVVAVLDALGIERAHVVGHDWGAAVAHLLASHHGEACLSVAALAVPPISGIPRAARRVPRQLVLSWYMTFFQLPVVAERAVRARDWALIRWLWKRWSPAMTPPTSVIETFEQPGVVDSALAYYRQNATPPLLLGLRTTPTFEPRPARAPVLIANGDRDGCMDPRTFDQAIDPALYPHGLRHELMPGLGHFLHLEAPDRVNDLLVEWISQQR